MIIEWREQSCATAKFIASVIDAQDKVIAAESLDTTRTLVLSGRPLRLIPNDWLRSWEKDPVKVKEFCDKGMLGLPKPWIATVWF